MAQLKKAGLSSTRSNHNHQCVGIKFHPFRIHPMKGLHQGVHVDDGAGAKQKGQHQMHLHNVHGKHGLKIFDTI